LREKSALHNTLYTFNFQHSTNVILVFSVKESGRFQGFARLASDSRHDGIPVPWVLPPGFDRRILGGTFKVDWLNRYLSLLIILKHFSAQDLKGI